MLARGEVVEITDGEHANAPLRRWVLIRRPPTVTMWASRGRRRWKWSANFALRSAAGWLRKRFGKQSTRAGC